MVIRDNVHGDIRIPERFVRLINTREFQRLRRIKQLATADQIFPGATHSRFAHSIGTFHIMNKILQHFIDFFQSIGQAEWIDEEEKNAMLAAALLHDIGHGPFSHAFEKAHIFDNTGDHEAWTKEIIRNEKTEIYKELFSWSETMPQKVLDYIEFRKNVKNEGGGADLLLDRTELNFKFIFASLVSSQLDADRMDYLLRDSLACGVKFGQFDIENLIEGMSVAVDAEGGLRVCVRKGYLANVEEYFYARYQMYRNVYLHPYKVLSETLLQKILRMACNLYLEGKLQANVIPLLVREVFDHAELSVNDFIELDDTVVVGAIHTWANLSEKDNFDLKMLCNSFLYRKNYRRVLVFDQDYVITKVKNYLNSLKLDNVEDKMDLIFIECRNDVAMYDASEKKPVYILGCSGNINNLAQVSGLMGEKKSEKNLYYNRNIAEHYVGVDHIKYIDNILKKYDVINNIEIEKKYLLLNGIKEDFAKILCEFFERKGYKTECASETIEQIDIYYDTNKYDFLKEKCTVRVRKRKEEYIVTCKLPSISDSNGEGGQLERGEHEEKIKDSNIKEAEEFVSSCYKDLFNAKGIRFSDLREKIKITNKRYKIKVSKESQVDSLQDEKYEVVLDKVTYARVQGGAEVKENQKQECQMEIELKSSIATRINMLRLTDAIEKEFTELKRISESKYQRAVELTQ